MDLLLNRFRSVTVLLLVLFGQLLLLAYQVKTNQDVRLIRVWAVTAVTPLARVMEFARRNSIGFVDDYFVLLDVREKNRQLAAEIGRLKLENQYLHSELQTADRVRALTMFQASSPSQTLAVRIIGTGPGANSRVVFIDRGSTSGVQKGMAVITPDGIVGKVVASFPTASQVQLITDPNFAAGVVSDKNKVRGTLKGKGHSTCSVEYVQNEETLEVGERFYTSGDDRIFPRGMPVGAVTVVRQGKDFYKDITVEPSGISNGFDELLVVLEGVHQGIPETGVNLAAQPMHRQAPPPEGEQAASRQAVLTGGLETEADKLRERYRQIGDAQRLKFGDPNNRVAPNFNIDLNAAKTAAAAAAARKLEAGGTSSPGGGAQPGGAESPVPAPGPAQPQRPAPGAAAAMTGGVAGAAVTRTQGDRTAAPLDPQAPQRRPGAGASRREPGGDVVIPIPPPQQGPQAQRAEPGAQPSVPRPRPRPAAGTDAPLQPPAQRNLPRPADQPPQGTTARPRKAPADGAVKEAGASGTGSAPAQKGAATQPRPVVAKPARDSGPPSQ
jgi:rod shape-determining protein MreC